MHFSIPDSVEVRGSDGVFLVYNIHINGNFHCALRYRQLLGLHEQLKKEFGNAKIPSFPPKRFLSLSANQLEDRRTALEKYIQNASQNYEISTSDLFTGFLRLAQHETDGDIAAKRSVDVFLPNGHKSTLELWNNSSSSVLLKTFLSDLKLPENLVAHFGLYIFRRDSDGNWLVLKKLEEFESAFISLKWLNSNSDHRIVLRKCTWDPAADELVLADPVGLHLSYVQIISDIENGWILVPKESLKQLTHLQTQGIKLDYVRAVQRLKFYGYMKFCNCVCDFPEKNTLVTAYIGNRDLVLITPRREEITFKVTRMKCWRITLHHDPEGATKAELSFEYLHSKERLDWITILCEQAVIMTVCLQEMVANMVAKSEPSNPSLIGTKSVRSIFYYISRNGSQIPINEDILISKPTNGSSSSSSTPTRHGSFSSESPSSTSLSNGGGQGELVGSPSTPSSRQESCDISLSSSSGLRRSSSHSLRKQNSFFSSNDNLLRENSVFAGIGDDDL